MIAVAIQADVPLHHRCLVVTILQDHDCCCNTSRCSPSQMNFQWLLYYKIMIAIAIQNVQWLLTVRSWLLLQYKMFSGYKLQDHAWLLLQYKLVFSFTDEGSVVTNCKVMFVIAIQDVQWLQTARSWLLYCDTRCSVVTNARSWLLLRYKMFSGY